MQIKDRKDKNVKQVGYTIKMDEPLLDKIRDKAKEKDMSMNLLINILIKKGVL